MTLHGIVDRHPVGLVWGGMLVYATGPVILAGSDTTGGTFALVRLAIGVLVVGVLAAVWHECPDPGEAPTPATWFQPVGWTILGGACFGAHQLTLALAVKATSVADVAVLNAVSPIVVAALALPLLGERPSRRFLRWTPVAVAGSGVVAYLGASGPQGDMTGMALAFANVVFFSVFMVCSKLATQSLAVWPFLWGVMLVACTVVMILHVLLGIPVVIPGGKDFFLALVMALGPGALGHFLMTAPLRWVPVSLPPVIRLLQPFVSGGLAWALLAQTFSLAHFVGAFVTAIGVLGAIRRAPPHNSSSRNQVA